MKTEVPLCRLCCFCLPLRYGLLLWGYLSLLSNSWLLVWEVYSLYYIMETFEYLSESELILEMSSAFATVAFFALSILLIVASHKKNVRLMKLYSTYALVTVVANGLLMTSSFILDVKVYSEFDVMHWYLNAQFIMISITVGLQLYIVALARSQIFKLENNSKFECRNIAAEALYNYYGPSNKLTNNHIV